MAPMSGWIRIEEIVLKNNVNQPGFSELHTSNFIRIFSGEMQEMVK